MTTRTCACPQIMVFYCSGAHKLLWEMTHTKLSAREIFKTDLRCKCHSAVECGRRSVFFVPDPIAIRMPPTLWIGTVGF